MPVGSPGSENYVVYTLDNEDTASSSGLEDGQIVFRDPEHVSLQEKDLKKNGNGRLRSISFESSSHWGQKTSMKRRCCFLWNLILIIVIATLATFLVVTYKDLKSLRSSLESNRTSPDFSKTFSETLSTLPPTQAHKRQICETTDCIQQAASLLSRMDTNVNPCEDFYEFACGGFLQQPHLSWESQRVLEVPDVLRQKYGTYLEDSLSAPLSLSEPLDKRTVKTLYRDCKDGKETLQTAREKLRHLLVSLKSNNGVGMKNDTRTYFTRLLATVMKNYGATPFFIVIVKKNGDITLTNRYSNDVIKELFNHGVEVSSFRYLMPADFNFRYPPDQVLLGYESFLSESLLSVFGNETYNPDVDGLLHSTMDVFEFEMALNKVWYSDGGVNYSEEISYCKNRMSVSTLQNTYPEFDINWTLFFSILLDRPVDNTLELCHADLVGDIAYVISEAKIELLTNYILTHTFINTDLYKYVYRHFPKFPKSTSLYKSKDSDYNNSYCISFLSKFFPLPAIFKSNHSANFEEISRRLFTNIKDSLMQTIQDLYWIPETQRWNLVSHTRHVNLSFNWNTKHNHDYSYMTNNYQQNVIGAIETKHVHDKKGIHIISPFDQTISSYNSWTREIDISALSLQSPIFYNNGSSETLVIGSVGGMLAQAFAEVFGLDALLSHFMSGTLDESVLYTLSNHHECLIDFYNAYHYPNEKGETIHVRGDLTKSSNFRDLLSMHLVVKTFQNSLPQENIPILPGVNYTNSQTFFISYAQLYCEKVTPRGNQLYYVNNEDSKHPLHNEFRIKGMMTNTKQFADAFSCPDNTAMNPAKRCTIF